MRVSFAKLAYTHVGAEEALTSQSLREGSVGRWVTGSCDSSSLPPPPSLTRPLTLEKEEMRRDLAISNRSAPELKCHCHQTFADTSADTSADSFADNFADT